MSKPQMNSPIVVLGAGIIGLNVALVLCEQGLGPQITIVGEYLPGDTSKYYTSPWAGCNFSAISGSDSNALKWDRAGYVHLTRLASEDPENSFVEYTPSLEYWEESVPEDKIRHMSNYLKDFQIIPSKDLPNNTTFGISFTTFCINAPKHIEFLHRRLRDQYQVRFIRAKLPSVEAAYGPHTKIVFSCPGIAARTLQGVEDCNVFPTRGQVVLVKAPSVRTVSMIHGKGYETYIIPRPRSNGNVVLGGYMQARVNDGSTYGYETDDILNRTRNLDDKLDSSQTEVLASFAGLRPSRVGGNRIERCKILVGGRERTVIHNYGAGGTGFQAGYGMALDAVGLAQDVLGELEVGTSMMRANL